MIYVISSEMKHPPTGVMTPIYLEPKPEPYLVHHLENSQMSCINTSCIGKPENSPRTLVVGSSPPASLNINLPPKNIDGAESISTTKMVDDINLLKNEETDSAGGRSSLITHHELTNMQPAPSSYAQYSPIYNGV